MNIIIFGPPGAGKGTQSEKIIKKYNLVPIATGDLFRLHLKNNTELGITAKEYMNRGNLVPDEIVINMVEDKINKSQNAIGFIFDGFPIIKASNPRAFILERTLFNLVSYSFLVKAGGINYYLFNLDFSQLSIKITRNKYVNSYLNN